MTARAAPPSFDRDHFGNLMLAPGTRLGEYEVTEAFASGGLGTLFGANDGWVLKTFRIDLGWTNAERAECQEYFLAECRLHPRLEHPHIVPARVAFQLAGETFLPLRYMPGGSLKSWIQAPVTRPIKDVVRALRQSASALQYLAALGLMHRDVSPSNILLDEQGAARLADFGFARSQPDPAAQGVSKLSYGIGRWAYGAPELYDGLDSTYDHRVDIYSLGVLGIALLTRRPPRRWRPEQYRSDLPHGLSDLLWSMVDDGPSNRPSWEEIIAVLDPLSIPASSAEFVGEVGFG